MKSHNLAETTLFWHLSGLYDCTFLTHPDTKNVHVCRFFKLEIVAGVCTFAELNLASDRRSGFTDYDRGGISYWSIPSISAIL